MIELFFVLLFSAAGAVAALLALRATASPPLIRWLSGIFLGVLVANIGLYLWPLIAKDPAGFGWSAALVAVVALALFLYGRMLRAARRAARAKIEPEDKP